MSVPEETVVLLRKLADKYETVSFADEDPSQFLKWYSSVPDIESACFIAAMLSFGNRKQFIPKIRSIFELADRCGGMTQWLKSGKFREDFYSFADSCGCLGNYEKKFYRFYSYNEMIVFFEELEAILNTEETLGGYFRKIWESRGGQLGAVVSSCFERSALVPHGAGSANKRIHMYLRWMVRRDSPVDLGLWRWYRPADLIIPLDTHVIQESERLGLIPQKSAGTYKTAFALTQCLKEIWPEDPCKGDFALFGLGVDENIYSGS